ncbi:nucleotidyltransferase family protein [Algoriphagus lutimaris]|uniref:nucleotidyltransferase family protein n=1 Tax=Algoriphagus lutimaris TaxID=613197 RepID=UPI00196B3174|nr:nucleotidyltransferase family protein [Algoriphagus lutimaris]MBN3518670.1 nucleotidyltransferase family protein [Algoriphagus lutimaris]
MQTFHKHILNINSSVKEALKQLDSLASDAILFLVDGESKLLGSLTDGDLRRGFIRGLDFESHLTEFIQANPKYIQQGKYDLNEIIELRKKHFSVFPVVNAQMQIINVVNFKHQKSYLPIDVMIMAGGRGERLKPLTDHTPKPLLKIGDKPIIEHNIDRLVSYGVDDIWLSVRYLGDQLVDYFGDGSKKGIRIKYVREEEPLGTAGALGLVKDFVHDDVLMMNSDLLTNIDFEDFYMFFEREKADFAVACISFQINVPYAVMETENKRVIGLKEKPTYTHYSNGGIYLMKKEIIDQFPKEKHYNATDLMESLISQGKKVVAYPLVGYWLDIGKHDDYKKAQQDFNQIKF